MQQDIQRLSEHVEPVAQLFCSFTEEDLLFKPAPDKWSKLEILGHLVDSAVNNLKRFTEVQFLAQPYILAPYNQDELVRVNHYQQLPLAHVLTLWQSLNRQLVYVLSCMTETVGNYIVVLPSGEEQTVAWWLNDYVNHLEHHLAQVQR